MKLRLTIVAILGMVLLTIFHRTSAQDKKKKDVIPHGQATMPGPALTPQEALKKMQVPPGFRVELVASEPDIVNPVAMTFDERGRIWITESLEYPKKAAGPGRDRVKVLESTKGDGKFDKVTTVIEGLNIPSGIAIGHGGVWVANAPDILFYPFEDFANLKLAKPQTVVTGFGRTDTHELPNSLTWGPDGWLYGLNGVFNHSHVKHKGKEYKFTCALFRIHPKTKDFEIFCEGTSNPWGLAINENGDFFVSACVIDHLWHLVETGYYHRQGGPYPPYTWKIGSIVKHKHQKAAYCGLVWFDSDAYPPEYREKLYMGNIHGGAINCDMLEKDGSTYFARPALSPTVPGPNRPGPKHPGTAAGVGEGSNFLVANDAWFMPVSQKVGPDGCLYILDWYDRYHCYQDANRDPAGIDRLKGRLYRVVYGEYKPAGTIDLTKENGEKLIGRLDSNNVFIRETAQRMLTERLAAGKTGEKEFEATFASIAQLAKNDKAPQRARLHAFWTVISNDMYGFPQDSSSNIRAWTVRAVAQHGHEASAATIAALSKDPSRDVQLQVAITARKLKGVDPLPILLDVLTHCGNDKLIPHVVWQNLHPLLEKDGERFLTLAAKADLAKSPGLAKVLPRAIDRILGNASGDPAAVVAFLDKVTAHEKAHATAKLCMAALTVKIQNGEIAGKQLESIKKAMQPKLALMVPHEKKHPLADDAAILGAVLRDKASMSAADVIYVCGMDDSLRLRAFEALIAARADNLVARVEEALVHKDRFNVAMRANVLQLAARIDQDRLAEPILNEYARLEPELQPKAIELLTQRPAWAKALFKEIAAKKINKDVINVNQARRLLATKDKELAQLIEKHWGIPRDGRNPEREKIVGQMKELYTKTPGDPAKGVAIFKKVCAQCHKMHGDGVDVGPDITANGRSDFDQLLSNIFDPSLVIGSGYQSVTVNTKKGQVINGLIVEDNAQRVVLKVQGGELKTIARQDVEEQFTSKLSMMPEDLERQLQPQEIVDLLAFLSYDRPPSDPKARKIPGTPR